MIWGDLRGRLMDRCVAAASFRFRLLSKNTITKVRRIRFMYSETKFFLIKQMIWGDPRGRLVDRCVADASFHMYSETNTSQLTCGHTLHGQTGNPEV